MPKFDVTIKQTGTRTFTKEIEAADWEAAEDIARKDFAERPGDWETDSDGDEHEEIEVEEQE